MQFALVHMYTNALRIHKTSTYILYNLKHKTTLQLIHNNVQSKQSNY